MRSLVLVALLTATLPAAAQEKPQSSDTAAKAEKKVCRNMANTGSRLQKRECHTASEWAEIEARNAEENLLARSQRQNGRL